MFGSPVGLGHGGLDNQAVAILHQGVADIAKVRSLLAALAVKLGLRISDRGMGGIGQFLSIEGALFVAAQWSSGGPSLGRKLLIDAQASSKVPSTVKCSLESSLLLQACANTAAKK